jgi:hypothetical protein
MAWHLFTWGDAVEVLEPEALRDTYREMVEAALRVVEPPAPVARARRGRRRARDRAAGA